MYVEVKIAWKSFVNLWVHPMKLINFKQKKWIYLQKSSGNHENVKICYICKENFENKYVKDKKYRVWDHCHYAGEHRSAAHSICNLKYSIPKKIPIAFHSGSNHDYHFII